MDNFFRFPPIRGWALGVLLVLGGCVRYAPEPLDTLAELEALRQRLPEVVVFHGAPALEGAGHPATRPFDVSDGLDEGEVVAVALTLNPDLQAKRLGIGQAKSQLISAGAWPNPEVGMAVRGGLGDTSGTVVDVDLLLELLRQGEREARQNAARHRISEAGAELLAAELELVAQVRTQWLAVRVAEQTTALLGSDAALRERAAGMVRRRRELGEASQLDASLSDLEVIEARREMRKSEAELAAARRELNRLLGLGPDYRLKMTDSGQPLVIIGLNDMDDRAIDAGLLAGRPEIRASESAYTAAEEELRGAILKQYPKIKLGPSFGRELDGGNSLGLGLSIELPVLDRNQGEIAEKINLRQQARAKHVALLHRLRAAAFDARARVRAARAEVDELNRELLPLLGRNREMVDAAFSRGELNVIDYLAARQRTLRAQRAHLEAVAEYRNAIVRLESALGCVLVLPAPRPATGPSTRPGAETGDVK